MIRILTCETLCGQFIVHTPPTTPQTMPDLSCKPEYALHMDDENPKQYITLDPYKTRRIPHPIPSVVTHLPLPVEDCQRKMKNVSNA